MTFKPNTKELKRIRSLAAKLCETFDKTWEEAYQAAMLVVEVERFKYDCKICRVVGDKVSHTANKTIYCTMNGVNRVSKFLRNRINESWLEDVDIKRFNENKNMQDIANIKKQGDHV